MGPVRLLVALLALALAGCATAYQKVGTDNTGGHSFRRLTEDVFEVQFKGNGFTDSKRASDFALLRAAEICREHNFRYFSVIGEADASRVDTARIGGTSYTSGTVNNYGGFGTYSATTTHTGRDIPIYKPGSVITIRCYTEQPGGHSGSVHEASEVIASLRAKYRMDARK